MRLNLILLLAMLLAYAPLVSAEIVGGDLPWEKSEQHTLDRIARYLSELKSLKADFNQTSPDGSHATGTFFLKRPGKMRWQYNPPVPVLMLSNGDFLTYIDFELEQVTHLPLDSSLAGFLAQETIRFDGKGVAVADLRKGAGTIALTLVQSADPEEGRLTLLFSDNPLILKGLAMLDQAGQYTEISLTQSELNPDLDERLFAFEDPRVKRFPTTH